MPDTHERPMKGTEMKAVALEAFGSNWAAAIAESARCSSRWVCTVGNKEVVVRGVWRLALMTLVRRKRDRLTAILKEWGEE